MIDYNLYCAKFFSPKFVLFFNTKIFIQYVKISAKYGRIRYLHTTWPFRGRLTADQSSCRIICVYFSQFMRGALPLYALYINRAFTTYLTLCQIQWQYFLTNIIQKLSPVHLLLHFVFNPFFSNSNS